MTKNKVAIIILSTVLFCSLISNMVSLFDMKNVTYEMKETLKIQNELGKLQMSYPSFAVTDTAAYQLPVAKNILVFVDNNNKLLAVYNTNDGTSSTFTRNSKNPNTPLWRND